MADETRVAAGKRFSRDMRRIREDRDISVDGMHTETRIARSLIQSFEEGGLYDHPTFNEVYLRSFVRAYAESLDISPEVALDGLDAALNGTYENEIAERYLGTAASETLPDSDAEPEESPSASSEEDRSTASPPVAGGPEGRGGIVGPPRAVGEDADAEDKSTSPPGGTGQEPQREEDGEEQESAADSAESTDTEHVEKEVSSTSSASAEVEEDAGEADLGGEEEGDKGDDAAPSASADGEDRPAWLDEHSDDEDGASSEQEEGQTGQSVSGQEEDVPVSPPDDSATGIVGEPTALGEGSSDAPAEAARPPKSPPDDRSRASGLSAVFTGGNREMIWAGVGIVVILLVLAGLGVAYFSAQEPAAEQTRTATASTPDSSAAQADTTTDSSAPTRSPPANVRLGETLHLTVLATADVSGIRIQRDEDLRRPYWIEDGDVSVFPFQERLTLENELNNIRLFLEGYSYPLQVSDTSAEVVISRSQAAAFVDTLRGAPAQFSVQPDTIPVGEPAQQ